MLAAEAQLVHEVQEAFDEILLGANHVPPEDRFAWGVLKMQEWASARAKQPDIERAIHRVRNRIQAQQGHEFCMNPDTEDSA